MLEERLLLLCAILTEKVGPMVYAKFATTGSMQRIEKEPTGKKENHTPRSKARRKTWQQQNREKVRACIKACDISRKYNMTVEEYENKLSSQNSTCALCRKKFYGVYMGGGDPVLDHSHSSGKVREFVHRICNTGLGHFKDDPNVCRLAAEYLEKHKEI